MLKDSIPRFSAFSVSSTWHLERRNVHTTQLVNKRFEIFDRVGVLNFRLNDVATERLEFHLIISPSLLRPECLLGARGNCSPFR